MYLKHGSMNWDQRVCRGSHQLDQSNIEKSPKLTHGRSLKLLFPIRTFKRASELSKALKMKFPGIHKVHTRAAQFMINLMLTIFLPNWVISKPTGRGNCSIQSGRDVARLLKKKIPQYLGQFIQKPCHITSWPNWTFSSLHWFTYDQIWP